MIRPEELGRWELGSWSRKQPLKVPALLSQTQRHRGNSIGFTPPRPDLLASYHHPVPSLSLRKEVDARAG